MPVPTAGTDHADPKGGRMTIAVVTGNPEPYSRTLDAGTSSPGRYLVDADYITDGRHAERWTSALPVAIRTGAP